MYLFISLLSRLDLTISNGISFRNYLYGPEKDLCVGKTKFQFISLLPSLVFSWLPLAWQFWPSLVI